MAYVLGTTVSDTLNGTTDADLIDGVGAGDTLHGLDGADTIWGGDGNDALFGDLGSDTLYGQAGVDALDGGDGNDILDGGASGDTMTGGLGDDIYYVDSGSDQAIEAANGGYDTVISSTGNYTLGANVENLQLTGSGSGTGNALANIIVGSDSANITITGGAGDDRLFGRAGGDGLTGGTGNDYLDGGTGVDSMFGGMGDDTYVVDSISDRINEVSGDGYDKILSSVTLQLPTDIEAIVLTGSANLEAAGNILDNVIIGNGGANVLAGGAGWDAIQGGAGADWLTGGDRSGTADHATDRFLYVAASDSSTAAPDTIYSFEMGIDKIDLTGVRTGASDQFTLGVTPNGTDVIQVDLGGDGVIDMMIVVARSGVTTAHLSTSDIAWDPTLLYSTPGFFTGSQGADHLLGGLTSDTIQGLGGDDMLQGYDGADTLQGGAGADYLYGESGSDTLYGENGGDALFGGEDNDILDGGVGADYLNGGNGDDVYYADDVGDNPIEAINGGYDTVYATATYGLTDNVEALQLVGAAVNGVGNGGDNSLFGTDSANGLQGQGGDDRLYGGAGGDYIEGGVGADLLDGGTGMDLMFGGAGDDVYIVDQQNDGVWEQAGEGVDTVFASTTYALTSEVENMVLTDAAAGGGGNGLANTLIGNTLANTIWGGASGDMIVGGGGADLLFGGNNAGGADGAGDFFIYALAADSTTAATDVIQGFEVGLDKINLTGVRTGASDLFALGVTPNGTDVLQVDLGGNGSIDMMIVVSVSASTPGHLTTADLLW